MLAHLLCVGFAGFVAYTARPGAHDSTLFSWHPTLMTAAFTLLAAEAVMMFSHRSLLGSSAHKSTRVTGHWMLMLLTAVSAVLGFVAVYFTKEQHGRAHLSTPHSMVGAATLCYLLIQLCAGVNLLFPQFISKFVDVRQLGRMHGLSGATLLLLATLTLLGGITSDWFYDRVSPTAWYVCLACPPLIYSFTALQLMTSKNKQS